MELHPTTIGIIFILLIILILVFIICAILYCCNNYIKTLIKMYLCCKGAKIGNEDETQTNKISTPTGSLESIDNLMGMHSFFKTPT